MSVIVRKSWGKPPIQHPLRCWWPACRRETRPGIAAEGFARRARPKERLFVFVQLFLCTRRWAEERKGQACADRRLCEHDGSISKSEEPTCMFAGTYFLHTMHTCQRAQRPFLQGLWHVPNRRRPAEMAESCTGRVWAEFGLTSFATFWLRLQTQTAAEAKSNAPELHLCPDQTSSRLLPSDYCRHIQKRKKGTNKSVKSALLFPPPEPDKL